MQAGKARKAALAASFSIFASGAMAATFVYVSNAEDGDIGVYTLARDGSLQPGERFKAEKPVMPMTVSGDKRYVYLLNELTATVSTLALDAKTGLLSEVSTVSALPADNKLQPGAPRPTPGRNVDNDIWASDLHLTPNGRFLYAAERTSSTINTLGVDGATGKLTYVASTPTEKQPRGFRIDPTRRSMIVTSEKSDTTSSYAIDPASGALRLVGKYPTGKGSNWVEIVAFD